MGNLVVCKFCLRKLEKEQLSILEYYLNELEKENVIRTYLSPKNIRLELLEENLESFLWDLDHLDIPICSYDYIIKKPIRR